MVRTLQGFCLYAMGSCLLPTTPGGNLVLIRLDNNSPEIFSWDHETEADEGEEPSASNMYMISDGLPGFLTDLYKQAIQQ